MKSKKKRIKQLEKRVSALEKIVKKSKLILIDASNPEVSIELSVKDGAFSTDRVTTNTVVITENITNQK